MKDLHEEVVSKPLPLMSRPLGTLTLHVELPEGRPCDRRNVRLIGGRIEGPRIAGSILPSAGDWMLARGDGVVMIDVRIAIRTDDGAQIFVAYAGYRSASAAVEARIRRGEHVRADEMYMRTTPVFETADPRYDWLTRTVVVGVGEWVGTGPRYQLHEVL